MTVIRRDFGDHNGCLYRGENIVKLKKKQREGHAPIQPADDFLAVLGVRAAGVVLRRTEGCFSPEAGEKRITLPATALPSPAPIYYSEPSSSSSLSFPLPVAVRYHSESKPHKYSSSPR